MLNARVKTEGRFVQLELGPNDTYKISYPFQFSIWKWRLKLRRDDVTTFVELSTVPQNLGFDVHASISLTIFCYPGDQNEPPTVHHAPARDGPLWRAFTWTMGDCGASGRCLVEIAFDTIEYAENFGTRRAVWPAVEMNMSSPMVGPCSTMRMLRDGILTDITLNADGGSIKAHRTVLATCSPVFLSMFSHDFREKALSVVDIPDMSFGACRAFVGYLYNDVSGKELINHREELVAASDKYAVDSLKLLCELSLRVDIDVGNVLGRLQTAHLYRLEELKRVCIRLLMEFGMIYVIPEDFHAFMRAADPDLVAEIKKSYPHVWQRKHKFSSTSHQDKAVEASGDGPHAKRARRPNVRLAGSEWTT